MSACIKVLNINRSWTRELENINATYCIWGDILKREQNTYNNIHFGADTN